MIEDRVWWDLTHEQAQRILKILTEPKLTSPVLLLLVRPAGHRDQNAKPVGSRNEINKAPAYLLVGSGRVAHQQFLCWLLASEQQSHVPFARYVLVHVLEVLVPGKDLGDAPSCEAGRISD